MNEAKLLDRNDTILFVVDSQSSLMDKVVNPASIKRAQKKIISVAKVLNVPIVVSEHYSRKLGHIIPELVETLGEDYKPLEKIIFSAFSDDKIRATIDALKRRTLLLIGIETHICILQTAITAAAAGYDVQIMLDGVSARSEIDHQTAIETFKRLNIGLTTWESAAYQWLRRADTPEFKQVLPIVKQ